ncbi:LysM peptidoglycan-binding domain-containing protein [Oceanobacillus halotolerans]|uniref:LysM peptidoglycan-binding domain-containing protein n=1 Tax=Oceanobacillus halotolerans TaxID=2663380 RepID=UPI001CF7AAF8|nr:LysM peptidoglycan-binding domain-containing protein [Oceanobacillus halotolerans]
MSKKRIVSGMESFTQYHINETEQGIEVILYLDENLTEFSDELGTIPKKDESQIQKEAVGFVKRKFPSLKVKSVKIMAGAILLTSLGIGTMAPDQASAAEVTPTQTQTVSSYIVTPGDTLYRIATQNGTTVDALKQVNQLTSNVLKVGQKLMIPSGITVSPGQVTTHQVKSGDTLYSIATQNGTTVDAIKQANQLTTNVLKVGQKLTIPSGGIVPSGQVTTHQVTSGDTLYSIATQNGTTVDAIKQANQLTTNVLKEGQTLNIPSGNIAAPVNATPPAPQTEQQTTVNQEEIEWLAKMIYSEGRGESLEGQIAIGAVIMNRVESPLFPNNVKDVLFEKSNGYYQFTPAETGSINTAKPNAQNMEAAKRALDGEDPTNGALFFYNPDKTSSPYLKSRTVSTVIGNHTFAF